ncbi:hypothetical protein SSS_05408 [Sarcoptes scabiei]|nr:hypothetical protein SSS_05408 [Sarcoptes scabiei]
MLIFTNFNSQFFMQLIIAGICLAERFGQTLATSEQCHNFGDGLEVYPREGRVHFKESSHRLHWSKAQIMKPAPYWEGTSVIGGEMKEMNLTRFRGKYLVFFFYPLDL